MVPMERFLSHRRNIAVPLVHRSELMKNFDLVGLEDLRQASYEEMRAYGVDEMVDKGLALLLDETDPTPLN